MSEITRDVLIIGAGAAGLTAANDLRKAGLSVAVLEARDPRRRAPVDRRHRRRHARDRRPVGLARSGCSQGDDRRARARDLQPLPRGRQRLRRPRREDAPLHRRDVPRLRRDRGRDRTDHRDPRRAGRRDRPRPAVGAPERRGVGLHHLGRLAALADRRRRGRAEPGLRHGLRDAHQAHALVLAAAVAADGRIRRFLLEPRRRRLHPRQARGRGSAAGSAAPGRAPGPGRAAEPAGAQPRVVGRRRRGHHRRAHRARSPCDPRARSRAVQPYLVRPAAAASPASAAPAPLDGLRHQGARRLRPSVLARAGPQRHGVQPVRALARGLRQHQPRRRARHPGGLRLRRQRRRRVRAVGRGAQGADPRVAVALLRPRGQEPRRLLRERLGQRGVDARRLRRELRHGWPAHRYGADLRTAVGPIHFACSDMAGAGYQHVDGAIRMGHLVASNIVDASRDAGAVESGS